MILFLEVDKTFRSLIIAQCIIRRPFFLYCFFSFKMEEKNYNIKVLSLFEREIPSPPSLHYFCQGLFISDCVYLIDAVFLIHLTTEN